MTDIPESFERELAAHDAFDDTETGYELTTTVFDAVVTAADAEGKRDGRVRVEITLPTLSAAVTGEDVAPVVEDGWYETLERRLEDVFGVANTSTHDEPRLERDDDTVHVILEYVAWDAGEGVDDAKMLTEFVEGTYAQGIIPGYEYQGPAARLLSSAKQRGQQAAEGDGPPL